MKKLNNIKIALFAIILFAACSKDNSSVEGGGGGVVDPPLELNEVKISMDAAQPSHTVSPQLIGFNMIYSHFDDAFWASSGIKSALPAMRASLLRYPGGAPTNRYHWNNLNGLGWSDNWDPDYDSTNDNSASQYTDIDEYLAICAETGSTPLIGINLGSGLKYDRVQEGIDEAKALVEKCKSVARYYYLDNEPYHDGANRKMTAAEYIEQVKLYATAIKEIHPDAKLIINWEKLRHNAVWTIIAALDSYVDYLDVHWYWHNTEASFELWCEERPMSSQNKWYEEGESYEREIEWFAQQCEAKGYNIKLTSLEWNVGKSAENEVIEKYEASIIQAEMMMQFMNGGLEIAVMWPIFFDGEADDPNANRYLMDQSNNYELSPSFEMFRMISEAMGRERYVSSSSDGSIYPLIVSADLSREKIVYAHSKNSREVSLKIKSEEYSKLSLEIFKASDETLTSGGVVSFIGITSYEDGYYTFKIPPYSLAKLKLEN